jgi:hypothetical protein
MDYILTTTYFVRPVSTRETPRKAREGSGGGGTLFGEDSVFAGENRRGLAAAEAGGSQEARSAAPLSPGGDAFEKRQQGCRKKGAGNGAPALRQLLRCGQGPGVAENSRKVVVRGGCIALLV